MTPQKYAYKLIEQYELYCYRGECDTEEEKLQWQKDCALMDVQNTIEAIQTIHKRSPLIPVQFAANEAFLFYKEVKQILEAK
jgi:hypothetical protein